MKTARIITLLAMTTIGAGLVASNSACTKAQEIAVASAIAPVGACIADIALASVGIEDPMVIAAMCSAAVADVYLVVSQLINNDPSPSPVSDGGLLMPRMSQDNRVHLQRIADRALTIMITHDAGVSIDSGK